MLKNKSLVIGFVALALLAGTSFYSYTKNTASSDTTTSAAITSPTVDESKISPAAGTPETKTETATASSTTETPVTPAPASAETTAPSATAGVAATPTPSTTTPNSTPAAEASVASTPAPATTPADTKAVDLDMKEIMSERSLGSDKAPVTVIEYASLTCPHCAHFTAEVLPKVKEKLINTGKLRLIFRDFPLDKYAVTASKIALCAPKDKYFNLLEVLFQNQERWARAEDPLAGIMQYGSLAGMSTNLMKTCVDSVELENNILLVQNEGQSRYHMKSTPTFVFNNGAEIMTGAQEVEKFEEIVNKLSAGK